MTCSGERKSLKWNSVMQDLRKGKRQRGTPESRCVKVFVEGNRQRAFLPVNLRLYSRPANQTRR